MKLKLSRVAELMLASGDFEHHATVTGYSIDSRTLHAGDLFFAVHGERLDGHDFVECALAKGAAGAVIRTDQASRFQDDPRVLTVNDPLRALQRLGAAVRHVWQMGYSCTLLRGVIRRAVRATVTPARKPAP